MGREAALRTGDLPEETVEEQLQVRRQPMARPPRRPVIDGDSPIRAINTGGKSEEIENRSKFDFKKNERKVGRKHSSDFFPTHFVSV